MPVFYSQHALFFPGIFLFNRIPSSAPAHLFYSIIIVSGIFFNPVLWRLACWYRKGTARKSALLCFSLLGGDRTGCSIVTADHIFFFSSLFIFATWFWIPLSREPYDPNFFTARWTYDREFLESHFSSILTLPNFYDKWFMAGCNEMLQRIEPEKIIQFISPMYARRETVLVHQLIPWRWRYVQHFSPHTFCNHGHQKVGGTLRIYESGKCTCHQKCW